MIGPAGNADVQLVLDTGAVCTTLQPRIAAAIGYGEADRVCWTVTRTATAEESGYLVAVKELRALGCFFRDLEVMVADLGYGIDGLIGLNLLEMLNFQVRRAEGRVLVELIGT